MKEITSNECIEKFNESESRKLLKEAIKSEKELYNRARKEGFKTMEEDYCHYVLSMDDLIENNDSDKLNNLHESIPLKGDLLIGKIINKKYRNEGKLLSSSNLWYRGLNFGIPIYDSVLISLFMAFRLGLLGFALNLRGRYVFDDRIDPSSPYPRRLSALTTESVAALFHDPWIVETAI